MRVRLPCLGGLTARVAGKAFRAAHIYLLLGSLPAPRVLARGRGKGHQLNKPVRSYTTALLPFATPKMFGLNREKRTQW